MRAPRPEEEFEHREEVTPTPPQREYRREYPRILGRELPFQEDVVRWGPILGGVFVALGILVMLGLLGAAVGIAALATGTATTGDIATAGGIWGGVSLIVALFVGGWLAASTSNVAGTFAGIVEGSVVWAVLVVFGLVLAALGAAVGLGVFFSQFGIPTPGGGMTTMSSTAAGWTFVALLIGLVAALVGGWIGSQAASTTETRTSDIRRHPL